MKDPVTSRLFFAIGGALVAHAAIFLTSISSKSEAVATLHKPADSSLDPMPKWEQIQIIESPPATPTAAGKKHKASGSLPSQDELIHKPTPQDFVQATSIRPISPRVSIPVSRIDPDMLSGAGDGVGPGNGGDFDTLLATELDRQPRAIVQVAPAYPYGLRQTGVEGQVTVNFWVDHEGRVHDPRIVHSNQVEFDEPTLRTIKKWRFEPGRRNGKLVNFQLSIPIVFAIND